MVMGKKIEFYLDLLSITFGFLPKSKFNRFSLVQTHFLSLSFLSLLVPMLRRTTHSELSKDTTIFLQFKDKELEASYVTQRESLSSLPLVASILVQIVASLYSSLILPSSALHFLIIFAPIALTLPIVWLSVAESFPTVSGLFWPDSQYRFQNLQSCINNEFLLSHKKQVFSENVVKFSKRFNDINILRRSAAILTIAIVGGTNLFDMLMCASTIDHLPNSNNTSFGNATKPFKPYELRPSTTLNPNEIQSNAFATEYFASTVCTAFPSYFSNYAMLILIATSVVVQLTHICKFILMLFIAGKFRFIFHFALLKSKSIQQ